jgi:hypothetical protein
MQILHSARLTGVNVAGANILAATAAQGFAEQTSVCKRGSQPRLAPRHPRQSPAQPFSIVAMRTLKRVFTARAVLVMAGILAGALRTGASAEPLRQDVTINLGEQTVTLRRLDSLPCVESDYTKRFKYDSYENPKLNELRTRYKLDEVIAPGKDEFGRQALLMAWTHQQFKKFGQPSTKAQGALEILKGIEEGHSFFCPQYAELLVSAAASLGWVDRPLGPAASPRGGKGGRIHRALRD